MHHLFPLFLIIVCFSPLLVSSLCFPYWLLCTSVFMFMAYFDLIYSPSHYLTFLGTVVCLSFLLLVCWSSAVYVFVLLLVCILFMLFVLFYIQLFYLYINIFLLDINGDCVRIRGYWPFGGWGCLLEYGIFSCMCIELGRYGYSFC